MDIKKPKEYKLKKPNCVYRAPGVYITEHEITYMDDIDISMSYFMDMLREKSQINYIKDLIGYYETE